MQTIAVIGAGQMGRGIAQSAAQAGYKVLLSDTALDLAEKGKGTVAKSLDRLVAKEKISVGDARPSSTASSPSAIWPACRKPPS